MHPHTLIASGAALYIAFNVTTMAIAIKFRGYTLGLACRSLLYGSIGLPLRLIIHGTLRRQTPITFPASPLILASAYPDDSPD